MALHPATQFLNSSQTIRLPVFSAELAFIKNVEEKLASLNLPVSNKAVILAIIRHLEEESDPEKQGCTAVLWKWLSVERRTIFEKRDDKTLTSEKEKTTAYLLRYFYLRSSRFSGS